MAMYGYYAVIQLTDEGNYLVTFPDIENCFTQGDTLAEAIEMAEDALGMMLVDYEDEEKVPAPSPAKAIQVPEGASLVLIQVDTDTYR